MSIFSKITGIFKKKQPENQDLKQISENLPKPQEQQPQAKPQQQKPKFAQEKTKLKKELKPKKFLGGLRRLFKKERDSL